MNFESKTEIEARLASKKSAQQAILAEAKKKYEREERKAAQAKEKGESTWMLPDLNAKLEKDTRKLKKAQKKFKREKKEKKAKKKKKKQKKKDVGSESSEESDSNDDAPQWVEKTKTPAKEVPEVSEVKAATVGPSMQRDDWMMLDSASIPTVSRAELREKIRQDKEQYAAIDKSKQPETDEPGKHERELNPYWKTGQGTGLPEEEKNTSGATLPKHNLNFLKKAYTRCQATAQESGQSLEEVAAERFGSLENLEIMIMEAERREELAEEEKRAADNRVSNHRSRNRTPERHRNRRSQTPDRHRNRRSRTPDRRSSRRSQTPDRHRNRRSRTPDRRSSCRSRSRSQDRRSRSQERGKYQSFRDKHRYKPRSRSKDRSRRFQKPRSRSRSRSRNRSKERTKRFQKPRSRSRSHSESRSTDRSKRFKKPQSRSRSRSQNRSSERRKRFRRPHSRSKSHTPDRSLRRPRSRSHSKSEEKISEHDDRTTSKNKTEGVKMFQKPSKDSSVISELRKKNENKNPHGRPSWRKPGAELSKSITPAAPTSSPSSSESESSSSESEAEPTPPPVILTEDEMNALGAKILRAEIMGDEDTAKQLKAKLESARKLKESGAGLASRKDNTEEQQKVLVLSKADRYGNVRPLTSQQDQISARSGGKRKRARKVETHDKSGQRERYFPDDDRFSIQDMVQSEKMTSAQDHHLSFSKMASKITEKTDDDHQIDDAIINRARLEQDQTKTLRQQHEQAQRDSRKLAQTLDSCPYCLDNMTKHLILAVAKKTYLCVPGSTSLCEGHCQIIPIHHCISSTSCDEDIWAEVQEFRKALVGMFSSQDETMDCVFLETSKSLHRHPHMVIDCIPVDKETGDMAPIYFKKAIQESETEWVQNKKLISLAKKDVRRAVPKGFPYFAVDFGMQGGFAHVIEEEHTFPAYFGKEVIGGMLDVEPRLWRKPQKESFEQQRKKVISLSKMWKPYDFTLQSKDSSSSSEDEQQE